MNNESINNHPLLISIGINHTTAPLEIREKMFIDKERIPLILDKFKGLLSECMIVSTCNRTELYGIGNKGSVNLESLKDLLIGFNNAHSFVTKKHFYEYILSGACRHLFHVTTSVDSMVVGDSQVMHQIKESYQIANENGSTGKVLNQLVQKALHASKRVKSETKLFEGAFSVSYAAIELATKIFGDLKDKKVLVIGAGETAELTIQGLIKKNVDKIYITNRTIENAHKLIESLKKYSKFNGEVIPFENFNEKLSEIDIIISSTGASNYIINYDEFRKVAKYKRGNPMLIIDIAVPRDVDPKINKIGNVFLKNIDDLNSIIDTNHEKRLSVIPEVKDIISQEILNYLMWYYSIPVLPALQYIQQNFNGQAAGQIKQIRKYLVEGVTDYHQRVLNGSFNVSDEIMNHDELVKDLFNLNDSTIKNWL
ncbi:MAG TPA: glutamyl-tRNA reductase [Ignavibacteria bacterium]|jgi:glutamyl-tRNA reductase